MASGFETKPPLFSGVMLLPWSFSRLNMYETCALRAYREHVLKQKGPQSQYAQRGDDLHKNAASYVMNVPNVTIHKELKAYWPQFKELRKLNGTSKAGEPKVVAERKEGITAKWGPTEFFSGKDLWGRIVIDIKWIEGPTVYVVDVKTGKKYPEHEDQLRLYAAKELAQNPKVKKAVVADWYVDHPGLHMEREFTQRDGKLIRSDFEARVKKMASDTKLVPTANSKCGWCQFSKRNGGDCSVG